MFYVYILESDTKRYIGFTEDLQRRLKEHNAGKNRSTKAYKVWDVIYYEAHKSVEDAKRQEKYFKTSAGRQALSRMLRFYNQSKSNFYNQRSTTGKRGSTNV